MSVIGYMSRALLIYVYVCYMLLYVICRLHVICTVICLVLGGVVRVRLCYLMRICVITYTCEVVVGPGTQICTLLEVWVLGVGMSTLGAQTAPYAEDRGIQVPMTLDHRPVTSSGKAAPGPDPRIRHRIQIVMFRPIRVDHTNCLQVAIKTHSFMVSFEIWTIFVIYI
jgi:hypothetical protein